MDELPVAAGVLDRDHRLWPWGELLSRGSGRYSQRSRHLFSVLPCHLRVVNLTFRRLLRYCSGYALGSDS